MGPELQPATVAKIREAMRLAQGGDLVGARAQAQAIIVESGGHAAAHAFLGMLCCQQGDLPAGIPHLREALRQSPGDLGTAANLATALTDSGAMDEALAICSLPACARDRSLRLWRLRGHLLQLREDHVGTVEAYARVVQGAPGDFESWNNLGNARAATGDRLGSVKALEQAMSLRPDFAPIRLNLAAVLTELGRLNEAVDLLQRCTRDFPGDPKPLIDLAALLRHLYRDAEALDVLRRAVALSPDDVALHFQLGEESFAAFGFDAAEQAFHDVLAMDPAHHGAYVQLALLYEHTNRAAELLALVPAAETACVDQGAVQFLRALAFRRERRFDEGLAALAGVPDDIEPIRRAQLEGELRDRLGDADGAFAAFTEMNRLFKLDPSDPERRAGNVRAELNANRATVSPEWFRSWRPVAPPSGPQPVFLVGFPRSGTTLLDTMLMGHPDVRVLEERPPLRFVEDELGALDGLAALDDEGIGALRSRYFEEVKKCIDLRPEMLLVDKSPLHMNKVPLIHRMFPDARFILALRHPCDVVLSCFITSFRLNDAMANFIDLETAAHFYDLSFGYWDHCRKIMPIRVHELRYEQLVADSGATLRPLFDYLGLDWREAVLDHRQTAAGRGLISTASYAQVTEPIYSRSSGRWTRYREYLSPVLPILQPWVEKLGYAL